jgi:predicted nuclease of predicted toxin-antitoxin system
MKLLLDENLPKRLKTDLALHEVYTVRDMGWNGTKNGELLKLMISEKFDVLITFDKNLQYQQNFSKYSLPVLVLNAKNNTYLDLQVLMLKTLMILDQPLNPGGFVISL